MSKLYWKLREKWWFCEIERNIRLFIFDKLWFLFEDKKCEFCRNKLRRHGDLYHGGVEIYDGSPGSLRHRTAYLCNLCYWLFNSK